MTPSLFPRRAAVAAIATLVLLGPAAGTSLADRYVSKDGADFVSGCTEELPCLTIQRAVDYANPGEAIHIGPGTYGETVLASKPVVLDGNRAGTLRGLQPPGRTIVASPVPDKPAIMLTMGGEIRDLRAAGSISGQAQVPVAGIELSSSVPGTVGAKLAGVIAVGGMNDSGISGPAIRAGAQNNLDVTVQDVGLAHPGTSYGYALIDAHRARVTATDVLADPSPSGLLVRALGDTEVDVTRLVQVPGTIAGQGLLADARGRIAVAQSRVTSHGPALRIDAQGAGSPSRAIVTDSALASVGGGVDLSAAVLHGDFQGTAELTLRRSTLLARGPGVIGALSLEGSGAGGVASAVAEDSVIRATDTSVPGDADVRALGEAGGSAAFSATRTAYSNVKLAGAASATEPGAAGGVIGDPLLTDEAAADVTLRPGSPLIDRGDAGGLAGDALDLAGAPRNTDGNGDCVATPDLGAYERPAIVPCTVPPTGGGDGATPSGTTPPAADTRGPLLTDLRLTTVRLRKSTTLRWTLDEAATLRIAVRQAAPGRKAGGHCVARRGERGKPCTRWITRATLARGAGPGPGALKLGRRVGGRLLKLGAHRLEVVARDAAGNRSAPGRVKFKVVR